MARRRSDSIPLPRHPYRDSAIFHGALGLALLVVAWLTGGDLLRALVVALLYVAVAVGWTWWRFRARIRREAETASPPGGRTGDRG